MRARPRIYWDADLGKQVTHLVRRYAETLPGGYSLALARDKLADELGYSTHTLEGWEKGTDPPSAAALEKLVRFAQKHLICDRDWAERLLRGAGYPQPDELLDELWQPPVLRQIPNNLPPANCEFLLGRQKERRDLLNRLSPNYPNMNLIIIAGIGGVGKTALALDVAWRCLRASCSVSAGNTVGNGTAGTGADHDNPNMGSTAGSKLVSPVGYPADVAANAPGPDYASSLVASAPVFEAIIFTSSKLLRLTQEGIKPAMGSIQPNLSEIFRTVANTLNAPDITSAPSEEQPACVRRALSKQRTLLIVDNFETAENKEELIEYLYSLPTSTRVIITSRERVYEASPAIKLHQLPYEDSIELIRSLARSRDMVIDTAQASAIYKAIGGIPAALVYTVGWLADGFSMEIVLDKIKDPQGDVANYCFLEAVQDLRGEPAYRLLMALTLFSSDATSEALAEVAGLAPGGNEEVNGRKRLLNRMLIWVNPRQYEGGQEARFYMDPLTREYAASELAKDPEFATMARERWLAWYLEFALEHSGSPRRSRNQDRYVDYDYLEAEWDNLRDVFAWCSHTMRYDELKTFWGREGVFGFASLQGKWDDLRMWLDWLIVAAERRNDIPTAVEAKCDLAIILIIMGRKEHIIGIANIIGDPAYDDEDEDEDEDGPGSSRPVPQPSAFGAEQLLKEAWQHQGHKELLPRIRLSLARAWARLCIRQQQLGIRQQQYEEAHNWLDECEKMLNEVNRASFGGSLEDRQREYVRQQNSTKYVRAEVYYYNGELDEAKKLYYEVLNAGLVISWDRGVSAVRNRLADIAITQRRLAEAEALLQEGLRLVERSKDRVNKAYFEGTYALLELEKGYPDRARKWAKKALTGFNDIGIMPPETDKLQELVRMAS